MSKKKVDKFKVNYKYPANLEVKPTVGYTTTFSGDGHAIINFYNEYPEFTKSSTIEIYEDGESAEIEDKQPLSIVRHVHSSLKLNLEVLAALSNELNEFLEFYETEIASEDEELDLDGFDFDDFN